MCRAQIKQQFVGCTGTLFTDTLELRDINRKHRVREFSIIWDFFVRRLVDLLHQTQPQGD